MLQVVYAIKGAIDYFFNLPYHCGELLVILLVIALLYLIESNFKDDGWPPLTS